MFVLRVLYEGSGFHYIFLRPKFLNGRITVIVKKCFTWISKII